MRLVILVVLAALLVSPSALASGAHRHYCHIQHACPSDHASYTWRGLVCVKPTSDERTSAFKRKVVYGGRTYFCKRA